MDYQKPYLNAIYHYYYFIILEFLIRSWLIDIDDTEATESLKLDLIVILKICDVFFSQYLTISMLPISERFN